MNKKRIRAIAREAEMRLEKNHIGCFEGMDKPLFLISEQYPGIWLEHVYDSVFYAMQDKTKLYLAENTVDLFISNQREDGQYPFNARDRRKMKDKTKNPMGFAQIQECVSFGSLCLMVYRLNSDKTFLERCYCSLSKWVQWLKRYRMTTSHGLIETFVGYDTGHDNSARLEGLSCIRNYTVDGVVQNASVLPENDNVAPLLTVDMNSNFYGNLRALSEMAKLLSRDEESAAFSREAELVKEKIFEYLYDPQDAFFYDVDKNGKKRKYLSSTIFHLFMERVLDKDKDRELIDEIYKRHISNPDEFATPYPYPSMAISDPSCKNHGDFNCWGYYSEGLIALRATLWMEEYGYEREFERLALAWLDAWCEHYDEVKLGQELDPLSGVPTKSSEWYSSTMLFFIYAAKRFC